MTYLLRFVIFSFTLLSLLFSGTFVALLDIKYDFRPIKINFIFVRKKILPC